MSADWWAGFHTASLVYGTLFSGVLLFVWFAVRKKLE